MRRIAFYAPIKPPDHPIASGDRLIARNLLAALDLAGFNAELASSYIAYSKRDSADILEERKAGALAEAEAVIQRLDQNRPDVWLTYHPYCKAPDWIGPIVSEAFGIPYVTVEAARTGQGFENGGDRWAPWRKEAQSGLHRADLHLAFKPTDRAYLIELLGDDVRIRDIAPFFDATVPRQLPDVGVPSHWRSGAPILVTTAMMRPGKKVVNFKMLARALEPLQALHWNLVLIGGGPEEPAIRGFFSRFSQERLHWTGAVSRAEVLSWMKRADLFVWPGWQEPIGMVYLEAQLMGTPVAALRSMGVPLVVAHGKTGLLAQETPPDSAPDPYTGILRDLISHPTLRADLGEAAAAYVGHHHSLAAGASALNAHLTELLTAD